MKALTITAAILITGLAAGCASSPDNGSDGTGTGDFTPMAGVARRAVVVGLTKVDPAAYGGWNGDCPGCDVDAQRFGQLCRDHGLQVAELHNKAASLAGVRDAARAAWRGMKAGDLFVLFVSGHGGQIKDTNGDEEDGQDETLCLWDGQCSDDYLRKLWEEIPAGVRVLYVTDTCNSGTNFRYKPRAVKRSLPRAYKGAMIHFGGCADGLSSYGSALGGTFTTALVETWYPKHSYAQWCRAAAEDMPKRAAQRGARPRAERQVPVYGEYGAVGAEFRDAPALK